MKELTIENKAKAYDKAIKRAEKWRNAPNVGKIPTFANRVIEEIFPELKESENERIRKDLLGYLHTLPNHFSHNGSLVTEWIAWLEKKRYSEFELENEYWRGYDDAKKQGDRV